MTLAAIGVALGLGGAYVLTKYLSGVNPIPSPDWRGFSLAVDKLQAMGEFGTLNWPISAP